MAELNIKYDKIDTRAFEEIFKKHFTTLVYFAHKYLHDQDTAKEIVHDIFINFWEKRDTLNTDRSLKSYLFTSVHNRCLNYIRDNKKFDHSEFRIDTAEEKGSWDDSDKVIESENIEKIQSAIEKLPEKCKAVFKLSRFENLKYNEIAEKLGVSVKTVEAQMSKALKTLKNELAEFLTILLIFIYFFNALGYIPI